MGNRISFRRRLQPSVKVDLIPMIDIVFQLVVFFMVTSIFAQKPAIEIILPEASTAEVVMMDEIVISISKDDALYFNEKAVNMNVLEKELQAVPMEKRDKQSVILEGDASSSLGKFVSVLDVLRKNGFDNYAVPVTVSELNK